MHKNTDQKHGKMFPCLTGKKAPAGEKPAELFSFAWKPVERCMERLPRRKPGIFAVPESEDLYCAGNLEPSWRRNFLTKNTMQPAYCIFFEIIYN